MSVSFQNTASSEQVVEILERITDAFVALDNNWCYTYMNKKAGELARRNPAQMIGKNIWSEFPEGIGQPYQLAYERAMSTQQYVYIEEYYAPYDLWFEIHVYPSPEGLSIFFRDITAKKKAEQELEKNKNFIESVINASQDIIYIYDIEERKNVFINEGMQNNLGYTDDEIKQMGEQVLPLLMPADDFESYLQNICPRYAALKDKEILTHEFRMRHKDGSLHWLFTKESIFLRNPDGTPKQIFGITADITERKETELKLDQERQKRNLLLDNAYDGIFVLNQDFQVVETNQAFSTMLGLSHEETLRTYPWNWDVIYSTKEILNQTWPELTMRVQKFETKLKHKNGTIFDAEITGSPTITEWEGQKIMLFICRDISERKRAEDEIRRSEEKYRTLVEQASDAIFIADSAGRFITVNTSACKLSQFSETELLKMSIYDFAVMEDIQKNPFHFEELKQGKTVITERLMKGKNGIPLQVEINAKLLTDGRLLTFVRDITERKKNEDALRESNLSLSEAHRIAKIGSWTYYIGGNLKWSDNIHQLYGLSTKITNTTPEFFFELVHPDDRAKMQQWMQACLAGDAAGEYEFRSILPDGSIHYYSGSGEMKYDTENAPVYMQGIVQDITERKKAEVEIQKLATIVQRSSEFIGIAGLDGKAIYLNEGGKKIVGLIRDITTTTMWDFFAQQDLEIFQSKIIPNVQKEGRWVGDINLRNFQTGEQIPVWMDIFYISHPVTKEPIAYATVTTDITDRKKAEEEIKNTTKQLRQLTTHLQTIREEERKHIAREIHDELGQQLTAVKMDVAWIDKNTDTESKTIKSKLKNTINLLDMSNLSIRKILTELRTGIMNNRGLTDALEWQSKQFTETTGTPVSFKGPKQEIEIEESIANCLFRVYQEALTNITRYAKAGKVKASLSCDQNTIKMMVEDDGKGFDMAVLKNKRSFGILGMKERVSSLNGIFILTSSPGKGTKISVAIPLATDKSLII